MRGGHLRPPIVSDTVCAVRRRRVHVRLVPREDTGRVTFQFRGH